ncbi:MAG: CHAP domain-containing protein [Ruminococcaceae bacterium]|nr:CHAP domain-containing protein [Oscillospiraceae bacterium]
MTAERLLELARGELGVTEHPRGSNRVKYNTDYYGREVSGSGYPWCCVFVWWLFQRAQAAQLFFGGERTAYCPALLAYHKKQWVKGEYQPGDVIFFNFSGRNAAAHVGICEKWDGSMITTIDGNTGEGNEANGGAVMRRTRNKKYIMGAYRPAYRKEETMTQLQFDNLMADWLARQSERPESPWGKMAEAMRAGITDGSRPQSFATREEVATMIVAAKL